MALKRPRLQLRPNSTGEPVDVVGIEVILDGEVDPTEVDRQVVAFGDPETADAIARVTNAPPAADDYGLVVRTIPSGVAQPVSGTVTITDGGGSITVDGTVAVTQSGAWNVGITGSVLITDGGGAITVDGEVDVSAVDLDIRDLSAAQDSVTAQQGGAWAVSVLGTVPVSDGGGSLTVDGTVAISGTVVVSATDLDIRNLSSGQDSVAAVQSGAWNVGTVASITAVVQVADNGGSLTVDDGGSSLTVDGTVAISGTVTVDTELPAAGALADAQANPTTPLVGAAAMLWNGSGWDRARTVAALGDASTGQAAVGVYGLNGASWDRIRGDTAQGLDVDVTRVQGNVSVVATDLDIRNLSSAQDSVTAVISGGVAISGAVDTELTTADLDTGAGSDVRAVVGLALAASGGAVLVGAANPMPVSDNGGSLTVDGTVTVTATDLDIRNLASGQDSVAAVQSGAWNIGTVAAVTAITNVVSVNDAGGSLTVDGTVAATQSGTWTEANSGAIKSAVELIDDAIYTDGSGTPSKGVAIMGTDGTNPQLVHVDAAGDLQVDVLTMPTVVVTATDLDIRNLASGQDSVAAVQSGAWNITNITGAVVLPTGAATAANQSTEITSLQLIDDIVHSGDSALGKYAAIGAVYDDVSPVSVSENQAQSLRMSSRRALYVETPAGGTFAVSGTVAVSGAVDTELPAAAALADNMANPTTPLIGAALVGYDGSTWDRLTARSFISDGLATGPALAVAAAGYMYDGSGAVMLRGEAANGLDVDVTRVQGAVTVQDGGNVISVDDAAGSLTVDAPVGTPVFVRLSDGAAAIATLPVSLASVPSHAVTNAGTFAVQDAAAEASLSVIDDWDESDRAKVNLIAGQAGVDGGAGNSSAKTVRAVIATDQATLPVLPPPSTGATPVSVDTSTTNATLAAANAARLGIEIFNDSDATLYLKTGATATSTSKTTEVPPHWGWSPGYRYTGRIDGVLATGSGKAYVTEYVA